MKRLLLCSALLMTPMTALADGLASQGLDDPEVTAPARAASGDWTGPYVGLSYGRTESTSTTSTPDTTEYITQCFKFVDETGLRFSDEVRNCGDEVSPGYSIRPVQIPGDTIPGETVTGTESSDEFGAFAGWRHDFGNVVGGIEIGVLGDMKSGEIQFGLDLGRVLAYSLVGFADDGINSGEIYGAGVDVQIGERLLLGLKYTDGETGALTTARVGIRF